MIQKDIALLNNQFKDATPQEVIRSILSASERPVITTNFGPFSASLLHAVTRLKKNIPVVWGDSGYGTQETYTFSHNLKIQLDLDLRIYTPKFTKAYLDNRFDDVTKDEATRELFTEIVKLEPLERAFNELKPDVWFTNIRKEQTTFRSNLGIFSRSTSGILKVSPFYNYTEQELAVYLKTNHLPNEFAYYDPTKTAKNRECGLHLSAL